MTDPSTTAPGGAFAQDDKERVLCWLIRAIYQAPCYITVLVFNNRLGPDQSAVYELAFPVNEQGVYRFNAEESFS